MVSLGLAGRVLNASFIFPGFSRGERVSQGLWLVDTRVPVVEEGRYAEAAAAIGKLLSCLDHLVSLQR